jgi:hypothetical protein
MADTTRPVLDRFREPAYTGANRCVPCTVVNVVIAVVLSALVGLLFPPAGAALFVVSLLSIYLRGYLVPGTPTLTKRYLPEPIRERFDDHGDDEEEWETLQKLEEHRENAVDPEQFLVEEGIVAVDEDGEDRFTEAFAALRAEEIDANRDALDDPETLAALFDADPGSVSAKDRDYPAISIDNRIRKWPSEAALLADVATDAAIAAWTDRWAAVPVEQRVTIREELRTLGDGCPACGGPITTTEETVESCCGLHEVLAAECGACGDRLREVDENHEAKLTR